MIEESLLKSNFLGRDGFRWWIGQIPPISSQGGQTKGSGWGNRSKVRILGYHPYSENELSNEDLPWAQVLIPTTSGSGAANVATNVKLQPGDVVFGFFLDGDTAQIPVIMSTFGRTSQSPSKDYVGPFIPFTGFTDEIVEPNGKVQKNEKNEQNSGSQKSPRTVSPSQAKSISNDEISYYGGIGHKVKLASPLKGSVIDKISTEIENLVSNIQNLISDITTTIDQISQFIKREIDIIVGKVKSIMSGLVTNMINKLFKSIAPIFNKGLKLLYKLVYDLIFSATKCAPCAHLAGVAAQKEMSAPIKLIQESISCICNKIIDGLSETIKSAIEGVVDNVQNFVSCAGNQFAGALINDVISKLSESTLGLLSLVKPILQFFSGFSVENLLRSAVDGLSGGLPSLGCGQSPSGGSGVDKWLIGSGPINVPPTSFDKILETANIAKSLSTQFLGGFDIFTKGTGNSSILGGCFTGFPTVCPPPIINIFGGGGQGGSAIPIFGAYSGSSEDLTASIIGIRITNPGSGYEYPPFIEIYDQCNRGYGAKANAILDNSGQMSQIYLVSEGENYTIDNIADYILDEVLIVDPGNNYTINDVGIDNFGNEYKIDVVGGSISKVTPINTIKINDSPVIKIKSNTGSGAILKSILIDEKEFQGELISVVDCVLK